MKSFYIKFALQFDRFPGIGTYIVTLTASQKAADQNWILIDGIADQFKGHGYCADNTYYIHAQESCKYLGNIKGTMHPNIKGHEIIANYIYLKLNKVLIPQLKPNPN
jgi:hypothetical protein